MKTTSMKMTRINNHFNCFLIISCLELVTTQYVYPALKPLSQYSYTLYRNKKVDNTAVKPFAVKTYADYKKCVSACYNKREECKSMDAEIVDENTIKCRFFNVESPNITNVDGFMHISSKPPNCSLICILKLDLCGKCKCQPSCAARNQWQHVCNCTVAAGVAKSCQEHYNNGFTKTGIYQLSPYGSAFTTMCEMEKVRLQNLKYIVEDVNERVVKRNNLITTLPLLQKTYSVFFKFVPRLFPPYLKSIIRLTIDNDYGKYGYRTPAVWLSSWHKLYISSAINGDPDSHFSTQTLSPNNWLTLQISQTQANGIYSYAIDLNEVNVLSTVNAMPQSFLNVKVYSGDPWFESADGSIKDLRIISGNGNFVDRDEHLLIKDNLIATLPYLEKTYIISFRLKPLQFETGFNSVIQLTMQDDRSNKYGNRIPSIWFFRDGSGKLYITSSVSGNPNYNFLTEPLILNVWSDIKLIQTQLNGVYQFATYLNGELVHTIENTMPQYFSKVKIYTANPWYNAQNGYIKGLKILNGFDLVDEVDEKELIKDDLIALLSLLGKTYSVSFKLKPRSYSPGWKNVIHLTNDSVSFQYEDGALAISFHNDGSGRLFISSVVNGNSNYSFITQPLPLNAWSCIEISQIQNNGIYIFEISLNKIIVHSIENRMPQLFHNIFVYTADPWYDAQDGSIKDLKIINSEYGIWIPMMTRFASWESSFWNRRYEDYVNGFGLLNQQWIGLKNLNQLTNSFYTDMRVDYFLSNTIAFSTMYYNIVVGSSNDDYIFSYDEYDSKGSSEPDLFNANGTTFKTCNNWWTTSCSEKSPTTTDYISYGTENLSSLLFFLRTNEIKV